MKEINGAKCPEGMDHLGQLQQQDFKISDESDFLLRQLSQDIKQGLRVLFITGAGLSAASGISPYRGKKDAIWERFVLDWGTRKSFLRDPTEWWNKFWLRTHERPEYFNADPNPGHWAISHITHRCNSRVVTQNIDCLHQKTSMNRSKLIEVHGKLGLYKCIHPKCRYSHHESIRNIDIRKYAKTKTNNNYNNNNNNFNNNNYNEINISNNNYSNINTSFEKGDLEITAPPCPMCGTPVMPQALLFDEDYTSHSFYQWETVQRWFRESDIFIFVGTSFSVGITHEALSVAQQYNKKTYNFNLYQEQIQGYDNVEMLHIMGPSEITLPMLDRYLLYHGGRPRLWYYH